MCGIAGFSGHFSQALLVSMIETISYRGPDHQAVYYNASSQIGLAHRRLSIIDVSAKGNQPMWDASHTVCIVFNGEIYNFQKLRKELVEEGFKFNNDTDTEVILNLYLRDGIELFKKLNGIFAFAIYDTRNQQILLARDHFGVKPLYYAQTNAGFLFASELKCLLKESSVSRELNPMAIHNHLRYLWSPSPDTMLKSIKKLLPGHACMIKAGTMQKQWCYYDLPYDQPIKPYSVNEAVSLLQTKLKQAVERQLISDVPVGAFLSGGLDSSAIVAMVKEIDPARKLPCFTMRFADQFGRSEGTVEDLPYAEKVAKYLNVPLHVIDVHADMIDQLPMMIEHLDEPQADPAALNTFFIAKLARDQGMKVLLSGAGGDDIFSGYRRHYALMQERYWAWWPKGIRRQFRVLTQKFPENKLRRFKKAFAYADVDRTQRIASYFYWLQPDIQCGLYSNDLSRQLISAEQDDALLNTLCQLPKEMPDLNKMLYLETKYFLADHNLNYTDKMSMAASVETRVPFLDLDLVEYAASLPIAFKQNGNVGKWILKKAMKNYLPQDVIYRKKTGFGVPLRFWLKNNLRAMVVDLLSEQSINQRGLFNAGAVKKLIADNQTGKIDATYPIFSLLCIELWCRRFLQFSAQR